MDHGRHVRLTADELAPSVLEGATIYGPGDQKIGTVSHMHGTSEIVVDVGGILGIGAKPVAVTASELDFMRDENGDVHAITNWTRDEMKAMPEHRDWSGMGGRPSGPNHASRRASRPESSHEVRIEAEDLVVAREIGKGSGTPEGPLGGAKRSISARPFGGLQASRPGTTIFPATTSPAAATSPRFPLQRQPTGAAALRARGL